MPRRRLRPPYVFYYIFLISNNTGSLSFPYLFPQPPPTPKKNFVIHTRCSSSLPPAADAAIAACSLSIGSMIFSSRSLERFNKSCIWRRGTKVELPTRTRRVWEVDILIHRLRSFCPAPINSLTQSSCEQPRVQPRGERIVLLI
jgi:hypothetical protein